MNRIDSRARGNAPQLLEKYKKLAHDAHLNGDRVQEEYYLQFADHYFRVIADQKQRQEESRQSRRDDRHQDNSGEDYNSDDETDGDSGHASTDRSPRAEREPRGEARGKAQAEDKAESTETADAGTDETAEGERSIYEPADNPFVRDNRTTRGVKPRKPRRRAQDDEDETAAGTAEQGDSDQDAASDNFDPATLPPSISAKTAGKSSSKASAKSAAAAKDGTAEEKPKRRRTRKTTPPADDAGGELEAVNG